MYKCDNCGHELTEFVSEGKRLHINHDKFKGIDIGATVKCYCGCTKPHLRRYTLKDMRKSTCPRDLAPIDLIR